MKDTTEMLQALGQQVVELMQHQFEEQAQIAPVTALAHIETALREILRQVGGVALSQFLESLTHSAR